LRTPRPPALAFGSPFAKIQQKDDELSFKSQEISELVSEHRSILDDVEGEWKGEVDEAKTQIEELRDVRRIYVFSASIPLIYLQALTERDAESDELRMQYIRVDLPPQRYRL
jgi:hypothetical protein